MIVAVIYAVIDESTQGMFGRTVSAKDLYADLGRRITAVELNTVLAQCAAVRKAPEQSRQRAIR